LPSSCHDRPSLHSLLAQMHCCGHCHWPRCIKSMLSQACPGVCQPHVQATCYSSPSRLDSA
jgi:hypothetical protein